MPFKRVDHITILNWTLTHVNSPAWLCPGSNLAHSFIVYTILRFNTSNDRSRCFQKWEVTGFLGAICEYSHSQSLIFIYLLHAYVYNIGTNLSTLSVWSVHAQNIMTFNMFLNLLSIKFKATSSEQMLNFHTNMMKT